MSALLIAGLVIGSSCAADDPPNPGGDSAISTQNTTAEEPSTATSLTATGESATSTTTATRSEEAPEPEWADTRFTLEPVSETDQGLAMTTRRGDDHLWLAERKGRVRVIQQNDASDGGETTFEMVSTPVLDITDKVGTDGEGGLLGLDFSPDGQQLYVSYTDRNGNSVIAEYGMDGDSAVEDSERIILRVEQPFSNHNGGQITVGPDGFLYIGFGDGGSGGDPLGSGQDTSTLLGAILRIDPAGATSDVPYGIPGGNPFIGDGDGRQEIWLYGVRNPWRFSFDAASGDLWIGDVGQGEVEEIDFLPATAEQPAGRGANLGWNILEGEQPFSGEPVPVDVVGPIAWYGHDNGRCSVTGGYVFRGDGIDELDGVYIFGDFCTGELFGLKRFPDGRTTQAPLDVDGDVGQIVSFGQGPENELYVFESDGTFSRLQTA